MLLAFLQIRRLLTLHSIRAGCALRGFARPRWPVFATAFFARAAFFAGDLPAAAPRGLGAAIFLAAALRVAFVVAIDTFHVLGPGRNAKRARD